MTIAAVSTRKMLFPSVFVRMANDFANYTSSFSNPPSGPIKNTLAIIFYFFFKNIIYKGFVIFAFVRIKYLWIFCLRQHFCKQF